MTPNYPACYVLIRKGKKLLFVLRENTGYMDGMYSLPAGRVEQNESFVLGAAREAREEVGLYIDPQKLMHVHTLHRFAEKSDKQQWVDVFFEVTEWTGEPTNAEPEKHVRIEWLSVDNLPSNIMDYQKHALSAIKNGLAYSEFGWPSSNAS